MSGTSEQDMPGDQDSTFLGWGQTHGKRDHRVMSRRWRWLETQEQLQCWDTHHGDRGGSSLSPRGPARDEVPARGCSHLVQKGFGDTGTGRRSLCWELWVPGASAALPKLHPHCAGKRVGKYEAVNNLGIQLVFINWAGLSQ